MGPSSRRAPDRMTRAATVAHATAPCNGAVTGSTNALPCLGDAPRRPGTADPPRAGDSNTPRPTRPKQAPRRRRLRRPHRSRSGCMERRAIGLGSALAAASQLASSLRSSRLMPAAACPATAPRIAPPAVVPAAVPTDGRERKQRHDQTGREPTPPPGTPPARRGLVFLDILVLPRSRRSTTAATYASTRPASLQGP
jgi:hypothetical protein